MGVGGEKQAEKPKPEANRKDTEMKLGVREKNKGEKPRRGCRQRKASKKTQIEIILVTGKVFMDYKLQVMFDIILLVMFRGGIQRNEQYGDRYIMG